MKYFVNAEERIASGHERFIEFQLPEATEEFWDETSLYLPEEILAKTGFGNFWSSCAREDIVFDMCSFSKDELTQMVNQAARYGGVVPDVISELKEWVDVHCAERIGVNWESDRALARRNAEREAYPVDPAFYEDVKAMEERLKDLPVKESIAARQKAYEALLRKYNMPECFFPFSLSNKRK